MPRSKYNFQVNNLGGGSSGRSSGFGSRSPSRGATTAPQPTMHHQRPAMAPPQQSGGMMSGLGSTVMTGMAFGAGSEIAHQAVRGIMGSGSGHGGQEVQQQPAQQQQMAPVDYAQAQQQQVQQNPCYSFNQYFLACLKDNANNVGMCQSNMDMLMQCEKDNARFYGI